MQLRGFYVGMLGLLMAAIPASQATASRAGLSLKATTLGAGADLTLDLGRHLNARAGVNYGRFNVDITLDEADITGGLRWLTVPVLLDYHPAGGGFRFSLGAMVNDNHVALTADAKEPLKLQGVEYSIDRLEGGIDFNRLAPYFGIGYGNVTGGGRLHFAFDMGVMYHGRPKVWARAESSLPPVLEAEMNRALQEEVDELQQDLSGYRYYPVISMGFSIAF